MKHTIITIINRDNSKSRIVEFKGDVTVIVTSSNIRVVELLGLNQTLDTIIPLVMGQAVSVRNWGTK